jgi:hypothetical protein
MSALSLLRSEEGVSLRPSIKETVADSVCRDAQYLGPLGNRSRHTVNADGSVRSLVPGLRGPSSPSAVAGFVVPVDVDPIDRVFRGRPGPHVGEECLVGFKPTLAHGDPTATVVVKLWVGGPVAPRLHVLPRSVFNGLVCTVSPHGVADSLPLKAAARPRCPMHKRRCPRSNGRTAVALACPSQALAGPRRRQHGQPAKTPTGKVGARGPAFGARGRDLFAQAAARFGASGPELLTTNKQLSTAIAPTPPPGARLHAVPVPKNHQTPNSAPRQINQHALVVPQR